jgi:hypothetical protein
MSVVLALAVVLAASPAGPPVHLFPQAPPPPPGHLAPTPPVKAAWPPAWLVVDPDRKPPKEHRGHSLRLSGHHCRGRH